MVPSTRSKLMIEAVGSLRESQPEFAPQAQLASRVRAYIRDLILSGRVQAGQFMRLERLAEDLGVSATPVREAMMSLAAEGFVVLVPRRGFQVAPITRQDIEDVFDLQAYLAGELAYRTARRIDEEGVAQLKDIQFRLEDAARRGDTETVEQLNYDFHRLINLTAKAPKLEMFLRSAVRYAPRTFYAEISGWRDASPAGHRAIVSAFAGADPDPVVARDAMRRHIRRAGDALLEHLDNTGFFAVSAAASG